MSLKEFGDSVKTKYPAYQSIDSEELGRKMLEKYPIYKDRVDLGVSSAEQAPPDPRVAVLQNLAEKQKSGFGGKVAGTVSAVGKALTSSERGLASSLGEGLANVTGTGLSVDISNAKFMDAGNRMMDIAKKTTNLERKRRLIQQAQESFKMAGQAYQEVLPSSQKSAGQIYGEGLGTAADVLAFGSYKGLTKGAPAGLQKFLGAGKGLAGKTLGGGALGYGFDVSQKAQQGEGVGSFVPGLGTAVGATAPVSFFLAGGLAKKTAGALSGVGTDVIDRALKNPDAVSAAIKNYSQNPEVKQQLLTQASEALNVFSQQKSGEYASTLTKLKLKNPIQLNTVVDSFSEAVKKFGGTVDAEGNLLFKNTSLTKADKNNLFAAWDDIKGWNDFSVQGLDTLRQNVGNYMKDFSALGNPRANVVLGEVKNKLTKTLSQNVPGYSKMLSNYGSKAEAATDFAREFQLSGRAKESTKINNLMRIFKKDPTAIQKLENVMGKEEAQRFLNEIAGSVLSNWVAPGSRLENIIKGSGQLLGGLGALATGHPGIAAVTAAGGAISSPRVVGAAATGLGKFIKSGAGTAAQRSLIKGGSGL